MKRGITKKQLVIHPVNWAKNKYEWTFALINAMICEFIVKTKKNVVEDRVACVVLKLSLADWSGLNHIVKIHLCSTFGPEILPEMKRLADSVFNILKILSKTSNLKHQLNIWTKMRVFPITEILKAVYAMCTNAVELEYSEKKLAN